jgi:hypothetical protein
MHGVDSEMGQPLWYEFVDCYAMRAREFSDAVALLGRANLPPGQCVALLEAINERRESCTAAANKVHQYLK